MTTKHINEVIQHLRKAVLPEVAEPTDGELLECFVSRRTEAAIATLVRRHGPMVWGVCRRILHNHHDAEDAFQATFLVLVRKAHTVAPRAMVANWLHGVAHQTALKARATIAKRRGRERQMTEMPEPETVQQDLWDDLQPLLDGELRRLPDKYRAVILLCDLEGKTRKEVARQLGIAEGTVASRLARGRTLLAKLLSRHGLAVSCGTLATMLAQQAASACVPTTVVSSTIQAASLYAAGEGAAGLIAAKVSALTEGVLKAMFLTQLKTTVLVLVVLGLVAFGGGWLTQPLAKEHPGQAKNIQDGPKTVQKNVGPLDAMKQERQKFAGTWRVVSCEVDGKELPKGDFEGIVICDAEGKWQQQTGNGVPLAEGTSIIHLTTKPRTIHFLVTSGAGKGETLHNIYGFMGKDSLRLCAYSSEKERPADFSTKLGSKRVLRVLQRVKALPEELSRFTGTWKLRALKIDGQELSKDERGEEEYVFDGKGGWQQRGSMQNPRSGVISAVETTGKYKAIDFKILKGLRNVGKTTRAIYEFVDHDTCRLCTGTTDGERPMDFSCKKGSKHAVGLMTRVQPVGNVIAWGKAVDGLQAGICFHAGEKPMGWFGRTVTFDIYLRNVGEKEIGVSIIETLFEEFLLTVEDLSGKKQRVVHGPRNLGQASLVKRTLEKGETIRLGSAWLMIVEPGTKGVATGPTLIAAPGKYRVSHEGFPLRRTNNNFDEQKWATGQIELKISSDKPLGKDATVEGHKRKVLTLDEAVKEKLNQTVTVEFQVKKVQRAWTSGFGAKEPWVIQLLPKTGLKNGNEFQLFLTLKAVTQLRTLGVLNEQKDRLTKYFQNKVIRLTGKVESWEDREQKGRILYRLCVVDLKQVEFVDVLDCSCFSEGKIAERHTLQADAVEDLLSSFVATLSAGFTHIVHQSS